ncbi:IclR family transcriptional regulator C-terminal domain-containing protein [Streptomyces sp. NPDC048504]|uniref:IclR family transcriptional regulator domain-containing protein n=1 Tax=Streptomyces sp. NPDC048504 TaxID=3365559 RepID=UPI003716E5B9
MGVHRAARAVRRVRAPDPLDDHVDGPADVHGQRGHHGAALGRAHLQHAPLRRAAGKVLVATAAPAPPLGPLPASWARDAEAIRERGAAFDPEEVVTGVCCAAVPLLGVRGTPVAALCVLTDPAHHLERLAETARRTGRVISAGLRGR